MKRITVWAAAVALLPFIVGARLWAESPFQILAQSDACRPVDNMSFEVRLTAYDGNQVTDTTTLWGSLKIGSDHNRVLMYFVDPASQREGSSWWTEIRSTFFSCEPRTRSGSPRWKSSPGRPLTET